MLFHIDPLRLWVHKVLPVVYDDSLSYYEVLAKVTKKLNEVIDLTEEQNQYIEEFSTNLTNAINSWEEGMESDWSKYRNDLNTEWADFQRNTEQYIENWKNMAESDIEDAIAAGINQFVSYFSDLTQTAVDAAERAMEAAENAAQDAVDAVMPTLESQFDERYAWKTAVGSPLVATTAAGMTDTTKVYVYAGSETGYVNGDWYYYDGTTWQDGGVYNSAAVVTDPTLSESGVPADAKAAGDEIADLKSAIKISDSEIFGNVDNTFPLEFEPGTYEYTDVGYDLHKNPYHTYDNFVKVVKTTVFNPSCDVILSAKTGYRFNVFITNDENVITRTSGRVTYFRLEQGNHYGIILAAVADNVNIRDVPVEDIVTITYESAIKQLDEGVGLLNAEVFGEPLNTFPLKFENGTYRNLSTGTTLTKFYGQGNDKLAKVVETTVFNAPCDVILTAKSGYRFNVFFANNGVITGTTGRVTTSYTLEQGKQYGILLASTTDGTDISQMTTEDLVTITYVSRIDEAVNNQTISVPVYPGGISRETGASDMAYDAFWNLRSSPLIRVVGKTEIEINTNDISSITYFNIYEYSEAQENAIAFVQAIRNLNFTNGKYIYYPSTTAKYVRICLVLPSDSTKTLLPLTLTSQTGICVCKNPNITDGSKIALSYIVDGNTYTSGQLLLPPNYTINRKPCPLVVVLHGTSSYRKWTQEIGTNSGTSTRYLLDYLTNEGFAVFDCYCFTSRYYSTSNQNQDAPIPLFLQAYTTGIKYVCNNYNVDINNVCFFAMSAGGNLGQMVIHNCGDIKPRAVAMLCPTTGFAHLLFREYFLYSAMRSIAVDYLDLTNEQGAQTFISTTHGLDNATATAFVTSHKDKFAGLICSAIAAHGATFEQQFDWMMTGTTTLPEWMSGLPSIPSAWTTSPATGIPSFVEHPELTAYSDVPVKYWQSFDDANVSGHANYTLYTWLKNGGTNVQWRTLPDGTGGHHAVDTDPNALKSSGTTRLGIAYTDIATTYVEMADFFYKHMAQ